jgi:pimeloyl-ACP methyl ester carboxylesterase
METQPTFFRTRQGLAIATDIEGPQDGSPVIFLHGGGQTRHSWGKAVRLLGEAGFRPITVDLRGHGDSDWAPDGDYGVDGMVEDLKDLITQVGGRPALVGASMGGVTALIAQGEQPTLARALVLVDIVPRIEMEGVEEIRAFMTSAPDGFASVEEAADAVAEYLPHRPRRSGGKGLLKNLRLRENGRYYWHWDPALLSPERKGPEAIRKRLENAARAISVPTLLIRGGLSRIVSLEGVKAFQQLIPHAGFVNIDKADHMVAGDANDDFNAPLIGFLKATADAA